MNRMASDMNDYFYIFMVFVFATTLTVVTVFHLIAGPAVGVQ